MRYPILLPNIFNHPFTYDSDKKLKVGQYVVVPFGKSKIIGIVWNEFEKNIKKDFKLKKIIKSIDTPILNISTIKFLNWFSKYNLIPLGMSLKLHLLSNEAIESQNHLELDKFITSQKTSKFKLSSEQVQSVKQITNNDKKFRVHVIQGTTGSGKTIVYFNSLKKKLNKISKA